MQVEVIQRSRHNRNRIPRSWLPSAYTNRFISYCGNGAPLSPSDKPTLSQCTSFFGSPTSHHIPNFLITFQNLQAREEGTKGSHPFPSARCAEREHPTRQDQVDESHPHSLRLHEGESTPTPAFWPLPWRVPTANFAARGNIGVN